MENNYAWVCKSHSWYVISRNKLEWWQKVECTTDDIQDFLNIPAWHIEEIQRKIRDILFKNQLELDLWKINPDIK